MSMSGGGGGGGRRPFFRRRKTCPFSGPNAPKIDYKDTKLLSRNISERGKDEVATPRPLSAQLAPASRHEEEGQAREGVADDQVLQAGRLVGGGEEPQDQRRQYHREARAEDPAVRQAGSDEASVGPGT